MNGGVSGAAADAQALARRVAREVVEPVAPDVDREGGIPNQVWPALRGLVETSVARQGETLVVVAEELAVASPAVALAAAGVALGTPVAEGPHRQWPGLRGADVDGLHGRWSGDPAWEQAVTAVMIGLGRAALDAATPVLREAKAAGHPQEWAHGPFADAATAVEAARLLLWDAVRVQREDVAPAAARAMARLQALDAMGQAVSAAAQATGASASRPGATMDRLQRDLSTMARVFGGLVEAQTTVTAGN